MHFPGHNPTVTLIEVVNRSTDWVTSANCIKTIYLLNNYNVRPKHDPSPPFILTYPLSLDLMLSGDFGPSLTWIILSITPQSHSRRTRPFTVELTLPTNRDSSYNTKGYRWTLLCSRDPTVVYKIPSIQVIWWEEVQRQEETIEKKWSDKYESCF